MSDFVRFDGWPLTPLCKWQDLWCRSMSNCENATEWSPDCSRFVKLKISPKTMDQSAANSVPCYLQKPHQKWKKKKNILKNTTKILLTDTIRCAITPHIRTNNKKKNQPIIAKQTCSYWKINTTQITSLETHGKTVSLLFIR